METKEENTYTYILLHIYIYNSREIYLSIERLANQLAKRKKANKPILIDHLMNSSSVANIVRMAKKQVIEFDEVTPTKEDIKKAKQNVSEYIINDFLPNL